MDDSTGSKDVTRKGVVFVCSGGSDHRIKVDFVEDVVIRSRCISRIGQLSSFLLRQSTWNESSTRLDNSVRRMAVVEISFALVHITQFGMLIVSKVLLTS